MSKVRQREKQKARRVRRQHGLREEATAASRPRRRLARAAVGMVGALGILFLGALGSVVRQDAGSQAGTSTTTQVSSDPAAPPSPPCPAPDGSSPRRTRFDAPPSMCIDPAANYRARFVTTAGAFVADLYPQRSPAAVNNFIFLARYHFYEDLPFHQVIPDVYAQTGDPVSPDAVGPGYAFPITDPLPPVGTYKPGSLIFANHKPGDNGSQFLVLLGQQGAELPHGFPLFGQVTRGLTTLERIATGGGTAEDPSPETPYRIERIDIIETP